ncbi:hypothetical protein ACSBR1_001953 [Camellia fascicularis]
MAQSAMAFLHAKLGSLIEEELKLLGRVKGEIVFIRDELQSMSAFLRVANTIEDTDPKIQAWVKQVREVAHDTDDVLDEFMLLFAHRHRHHHHRGFYGSVCKIYYQIKNMKAHRQIAFDIQDIKARVIDIAERRWSILRRCKGLPLAIVAISGVLASKDQGRVYEWELLNRNLGVEVQGSDMKKILLPRYNDLPYYLKSCLLYLSIFPKDHLIERMRSIRLWIAEGFVEVQEGKTLEEVAEGYHYELLNRSLIQHNKLRNDPLQSLQDLPNLVRFTLFQDAYEGEGLCFKASKFQSLTNLRITK